MLCLKMYESSRMYCIGYDTDDGDFKKICVLYKDEVTEEEAEDVFDYFKECERLVCD